MTYGYDDDEDTLRMNVSERALLVNRTLPPPAVDTMVTCPNDCIEGMVSIVSSTTYRTRRCDVCEGTGLLTKEQYHAWWAARRGP